ncbi:MAG: hypothetical protein JOZ69_00265, partial [Myxococcales bacterium]|nr:hypothetical protein [Myxococcales bacterium]
MGIIRIWLGIIRGERVSVGMLFSGSDRFWPLLGATLLASIALLVGFLLFIVPGIILAMGIGFYAYFVVDARTGALDGLKASWNATRGQKGAIFAFGLAGFCLIVAGVLALLIGVFVAYP